MHPGMGKEELTTGGQAYVVNDSRVNVEAEMGATPWTLNTTLRVIPISEGELQSQLFRSYLYFISILHLELS